MDVFVLITSIVMPWLIWITTVSLGIVYNEYIDNKKTKMYLPLTPFDNALRTIGPFLPLAPLAMRALGETFAALEQRKIKGSTRRKTHIVSSVVFFGGVQTVRLGVYLLLVKVVFPKSKGTVYPFSDHIFLGLAVSACAQFEAVRSLASFTEIKRQRRSITTVAIVLWALAACCALALATLCALDAHYTARYFHAPIDSAFAMVAGAALFHVPLLVSLPN